MFEEEEMTNVLKALTSGEEITMDKAENLHTAFNQEFNLTERRVKIINMISQHLESFKTESGSMDIASDVSDDEENPADNLKNEFNRGLMEFQNKFSIYRAAGLEDPNDVEAGEDISDGSMHWNDSYDDENYTDFGLKPEETKIFQRNFIKIANTGANKKMLFARVLQRWRIKALQRNLQKERIVTRIFFRYTRQINQKLSNALRILRLNKSMMAQALISDDETTETDSHDQDLPRRPTKKIVEVKQEIKRVVTVSRKKIKRNEPEVETEESVEEELKGKRKFDTQKEGLIGKPQKTMEDAMMEHVMNKVIDLDPSIGKQFSSLNKARYMRHVFERLQSKNRNSCFYTLIKINAKRTRAMNDVSARIKGKLLMAMHKNFSGDQVMHSYYRWYVKSNPDLLKKLATNLLIKLPLSNSVAAWRMLSLVRTHKQRDERAIMLKLTKGLMTLMGTVRIHQIKDARNAMQKMNPNHYTRRCKILERTLVRLLRSKSNMAKQALLRLRALPVKAQKAFNRLFLNSKVLKQQVLDRLKFNALGLNDKKRVNGLHWLTNFLKRKRDLDKKDFMDKLKDMMKKKNRLSTQVMNKLGLIRRLALRRLQNFSNANKQENQVESFNKAMEKMKRTFLLQKYGLKMDEARRAAISNLKRQVFRKIQMEDDEQTKKERLLRAFKSSMTGRLYLALDKLKKNRQNVRDQVEVKSRLFRRGANLFDNNLRDVLNRLRENKKQEEDNEKTKKSRGERLAIKLFGALERNQRRGLNSLNRALRDGRQLEMRKNNKLAQIMASQGLRELRDQREVLDALRDYNNDLKRKKVMGNRIVRRLVDHNLKDLAEAFRQLRNTGVTSLSKEDRQKRVAGFMVNRFKALQERALYKLLLNKNRNAANENQETSSKRGVLLGLMGNQREKLRFVIELLRRTGERKGNELEKQKGNRNALLRTLGRNLNFAREKVLRALKKKIRDQQNYEAAQKIKKDGLIGLMSTSSKKRGAIAFYRLLLNKKRSQIMERKKRDLLQRLGQRLNQVRTKVVQSLRGKTELEKAQKELKERNTRLLANLAGDWTRAARTAALMRLLRNKVETQTDDRNKELMNQKLQKALKVGFGNKKRWCLRRLMENNQTQDKEENRKKDNLERVYMLLFNKSNNKSHLALRRLQQNLNEARENERKKRNLLRELGRKLNKARNSALRGIMQKSQAQNFVQSQRLMVKGNLLNKMNDTSRYNMCIALNRLRENRMSSNFQGEKENTLKKTFCLMLGRQAKFDKIRVFLKLANFKKEAEKEQQEKEKRIELLIRRLNNTATMQKYNSFNRLRDLNVTADKNNTGKRFLLQKLAQNLNRARERVLFKMTQRKNQVQAQEQQVLNKKNFALNIFKMKAGDKMNNAFYRLVIFGLKGNKKETTQKLIKRRLFGNFGSKSKSNLTDAFYRLLGFKNKSKQQHGDRKRMINLLNRTQTMKVHAALAKLMAIPSKLQAAMNDPVKRKNLSRMFQILIRNSEFDKRRALERLRETNQEIKKRELLTGKGEVLDAEKLARELRRRLNNPHPTGANRFFDDIKNYIRRNPQEGRNKELLDAINNGDIKNKEDLFKYIDGQRNKKGFENIQDLLNSQNPTIDIFKKQLPLRNKNGQADMIKEALERNPNVTLDELIANLRKGNNNGENDDLLSAAKDLKKANRALEFMKKNNKDRKFNPILRTHRGQENPKLSEIVKMLGDPSSRNEDSYAQALDMIDENDNEAPVEKALGCIIKSSRKGIEDPLVKEMLDLERPSLLEFLKKNKKKLLIPDNKEIQDAINNRDQPILQDFIQKVKAFNGPDEWLRNDILKLENVPDNRISQAHSNLTKKKNNSPEEEFILKLLGNRKMYQDVLDYLAENEELGELNQKLLESEGGRAILSNEELMARLRRVDLEDDQENLGDALDQVWDLIEKLSPGEKLLDQLRNSNNVRKYQHILRRAKNRESPMEISEVYEELVKNRLLNPEVKKYINDDVASGARLSPKELIKEYVAKYKDCVPGLKDVESDLTNPQLDSDDLGGIIETLVNSNSRGKVQPALDFIDYGLKESDMDRLRQFAQKNKDQDPGLARLNGFLQSNPELTLTEALAIISEDPEEYGGNLVDHMLSGGDLDRPGNALAALAWANNNNPDGELDSQIDGAFNNLDDEGRDKITEAIKRAIEAHSSPDNKKLLNQMNESDYRNAFENMMKYIKANNDEGNFDPIISEMKKKTNPDLETLAQVLKKHKDIPGVGALLDLLNGKILNNDDILAWLKENNADGRYDDLIKALEENPNMSREELMKKIAELNPNGEMDNLLKFLNSEGQAKPQSSKDELLDYFAKWKNDPRYKEAFDYLDKHGLEDPKAFLKYLESINHDGRYDEMISKLKKMIGEEDAAKLAANKNIYDMKLFKPLKKTMQFFLQRLRLWNKHRAYLDSVRDGKLIRLFMKMNLSNQCKKGLALGLLKNNARGQQKNELQKETKILKMLKGATNRVQKNTLLEKARALRRLERFRNRKHFGRVIARLLQKSMDSKKTQSFGMLRVSLKPYKKRLELMTILLKRSMVAKKGNALQTLRDLYRDQKRMKMKSTLSNLYWNLRRNHLREKRHAFNIWSQKEFKLKISTVADRLKKFVMKKKLKTYQHHKQLYYETKYKKLLDGNDLLKQFLEEKDLEHKQIIVESVFERKNPWVGRVLEALTRRVQINEQILLWRLVDEMNIEKTSVARATMLRSTMLNQM